jgi:N-acetyl-alpha-D-glucosaminyl L-malate synthase BshA
LKDSTIASLGIHHEIEVIPNFLDCVEYQQRHDPKLRAQLAPPGTDALLVHMSNFRPVKRVAAVIDVFRLIRREVPARLLLVGDGPDRSAVERQVEEYGLGDHVVFAGEERDPLRLLSVADLFLLPSMQESFGLAALEAMACEVPVISSNVGGLPEIVQDDVTGYATMPDALDEMASRAVELIRDPARRRAMGRAAAEMVRTHYCAERIVPRYEAAYARAVAT